MIGWHHQLDGHEFEQAQGAGDGQGSLKTSTTAAAATAKSLQSCPTLRDPIDSSPPGSAIPGILQARKLEWVAVPFSRASSQLRDGTQVSHIAGGLFTI